MDHRTEKTTPEHRGKGDAQTEITRRTGLPESQVTAVASRPSPGIRQLNRRQAQVLAFIREYTSRHPFPPTLREADMIMYADLVPCACPHSSSPPPTLPRRPLFRMWNPVVRRVIPVVPMGAFSVWSVLVPFPDASHQPQGQKR